LAERLPQKPPLTWLVAPVLIALVAGGAAGATASFLLDQDGGDGDGSQHLGAAVQAVTAVLPSVVIVVNEIAPSATGPGGLGAGAGFVVDERGFIATNAHIVQDPGRLTVVLPGGERRPATLVSSDAPYTDTAVVRIQGGGLKALPFGRSEDLKQGEVVFAIGSPDFDYDNTVTMGVVSGLERRKLLQGIFLEDLIQTDAAINLGNSGGPLINSRGEVVGIITFRDVGGDDDLEAISFAMSSRTVRPIIEAMVGDGRFARPYFGIEHVDGTRGALVQRVLDAGPAQRAGIRAGDVIVRLGRHEINADLPFLNALARFGSSDRVAVILVRDGRNMDVSVELTPR
jgi:S1-C subfamily serine protease